MNNKNAKRILAVALAATMVMGTGLTAFAEGNPTSGTANGSGTGESNGHVEEKVISVTLPTSVGTTFDYIADPENLIGKTKPSEGDSGKAKDGTSIKPNSSRVYFKNSAIAANAENGIAAVEDAGYSAKSNYVRAINKSSHSP